MSSLSNYLRTYRRSARLTQEELAFLFGYVDQSMVGRIERDERAITLAVAHTCHLVFGSDPQQIFPAFFAGVEENLYRRLGELRNHLQRGLPTQVTSAKLELLHDALHRLALQSNLPEI